jgi:predicted amidohydrolase
MTTNTVKAGVVQFNHKPGNKAYNLSVIEYFCSEASDQNIQLISFPEMCITGYWHIRNMDKSGIIELAEPIPSGASVERLKQLSSKLDLVIGAGLIEYDEQTQQFYNSYIVCEPDGSVHNHRKIHCFINEHFSSGDSYTVFDSTLGYRIGVLTCYDNNIIENVRMNALEGADILLAPHQTGGVQSRSPHAMGKIDQKLWEEREKNPNQIEQQFKGHKGRGWLMRWLPSRAHDNGLFLLFSNGVGPDDDEVRTGNAMIIDCYGRIISETWKAQDELVIGELDMTIQHNCTGRRWLRGRKPHLYHKIAQSFGHEIDPRSARFSG